MPSLQVDGQTVFYRTLGSGPPLVMFHGWMDTGEQMRPLAESLAGYTAILPDLPGYGQSVPPNRAYPADFYWRDAALMGRLLDALGLSDVHIFGFSDGGETALLLGVLRPELPRSIVAWGAIGAFGPEICERVRRNVSTDWITDAMRARHPGQEVDAWPAQWAEGFCAMIAAGGDISLGRSSEIPCPLLLMLGQNDSLNPPERGREYVRASARHGVPRLFHEFPGAGHAVHLEQPAEFVQTVSEFLARVETGRW